MAGGTGKGSKESSKYYDSDNYKIFGLPPSAYYTSGVDPHEQAKSCAGFGVMDIMPCMQQFGNVDDKQIGLTLFSLDEENGSKTYLDIVKSLGYTLTKEDLPLRVAFLNDISISESWSNDYGESSFEGMMNVGSTKAQEIRNITGSKTLSEGVGKIGDAGAAAGGLIGGGLSLGGKLASAGIGAAEAVLERIAGSSGARLAEGSKVDFPAIWQGGAYSSSLSFTVRLYNPNPMMPDAYDQYILYPLACLLALGLPRADSAYTYNYPLLVKINCPGLFCIDTGYISGIDIIKGGDTNDITYQQQPGMVDLKLSVNNLYSSMIIDYLDGTEDEKDANLKNGRPTLKRYLNNMKAWADYSNPWSNDPGGEGSNPENNSSTSTQGPQSVPDTPSGEEITPRVPAEALPGGSRSIPGLGGAGSNPLSGIPGLDATGGLPGLPKIPGLPTPQLNNIPGLGVLKDFSPDNAFDAVSDLTNVSDIMGGNFADGLSGTLGNVTGGIQSSMGNLSDGVSGIANSALGSASDVIGGATESISGVMSDLPINDVMNSFSSGGLSNFGGILSNTGIQLPNFTQITGGGIGGVSDQLTQLTTMFGGNMTPSLGTMSNVLKGEGIESSVVNQVFNVFSSAGVTNPSMTDINTVISSFGVQLPGISNISTVNIAFPTGGGAVSSITSGDYQSIISNGTSMLTANIGMDSSSSNNIVQNTLMSIFV